MDRWTSAGDRFVDPAGRSLLLRGVNLGGDCKLPFPDGGTNFPSDFSAHREVSFVGRPFPLAEADEHLGRLRAWGMNCLRLLTSWEAVEHAGPGRYDEAYLDYLVEIVRRAGEHGFHLFIDFHQDVWSRMSGGDGAPGWTFEAVGLDFTRFDAAGAAHVMQQRYDYARGGRQEDRYPMMSWVENYRLPANGILWTLFFAGDLFVPDFRIEGRTAQAFLQEHFLGAMRAVARRLRGLPQVLGFDTLNEPGTGWIGQALAYRHTQRYAAHPEPLRPGPAWSPLDGLLVARGIPRRIPRIGFDPATGGLGVVDETEVNRERVAIWRPGVECPFERAGAYRLTAAGAEGLREDFFQRARGRDVDPEPDGLAPFFRRVAREVRAIDADWLIFAELDPIRALDGRGFPPGMPERSVNASHWYDVSLLMTKRAADPARAAQTRAGHVAALGRIRQASQSIPGGAPTLIGEFGIPFDLEGGAAYQAWARGDRSPGPWEKHVLALEQIYDALDAHLLSSTQWNYTASNRNDPACGDGWNQEDLSVFSRDQQDDPHDVNSGGRALEGFVRPYVPACQGRLIAMRFERRSGAFSFEFDADAAIPLPTEVYLPSIQYPGGFAIDAPGLEVEPGAVSGCLRLRAARSARYRVSVRRADT